MDTSSRLARSNENQTNEVHVAGTQIDMPLHRIMYVRAAFGLSLAKQSFTDGFASIWERGVWAFVNHLEQLIRYNDR